MRILFNSSVGLGDSAYLYVVLRALKRKRPDITIDVMAWSGPAKLFVLSGAVNLTIDAEKQIEGCMNRGLSDFDLYNARADEITGYDLIYNLQHHRASAYLCRQARPKRLIGMDPEPGTEKWYDHVHVTESGEHILDSFARLVTETVEPDGLVLEPRLVLPKNPGSPLRESLADLENASGPVVGVHPGAAGTERLWPYESWGLLVNRLIEEDGAVVVLFGSGLRQQGQQPVLDMPLADIIQRISGDRCLDLSGKLNVAALAFIINELDLYIGMDTGPTHLAELIGTPTVALFRLFSEDHLERWRPRGENVRLLVDRDLKAIEPDSVLTEVRRLMTARTGRASAG
jgi:ADP-heptose:LPS heptosyltransferase